MTEPITAMTWNLNGEGGTSKATSEAQIDFLKEHHEDTDVFLLQAVDYAQNRTEEPSHFQRLEQYFHQRDYHITHTRDWNRQLYESDIQPFQNIGSPLKRCKLTASRWDVDRYALDLREMKNRSPDRLNYFYANFPTSILITDIHHPSVPVTDSKGLQVWNTGVVYGRGWKEEKTNVLETIYAQVYLQNDQTDKAVLLGGDFNAPRRETPVETDGELVVQIEPHSAGGRQYTDEPFYGNPYRYQVRDGEASEEFTFTQRYQNAERYIFDTGFTKWDMRDTYWHAEDSAKRSSANDYTHNFHRDNVANKRLDHLLADSHFAVEHCEVQNGIDTDVNGLGPSDHAPVVATLNPT